MKKLFCGALLISLSLGSYAQKKGSFLVYGSLAFTNTTNSDNLNGYEYKSTAFSLTPGIGYQFSNNWTAGIIGGIISTTETIMNPGFPSTGDRKSNAYLAGPFVRYTQKLSSIFAFFGQIEGGYSWSNTKGNSFINERKVSGAFLNAYPAVFVNVKNDFGFNISLGGISYVTAKEKGAPDGVKQFQLTLGQTVNIGISKNF